MKKYIDNILYRIVKRENGYKIRKIQNDKNGFLWDISKETYKTVEEAEKALQNADKLQYIHR